MCVGQGMATSTCWKILWNYTIKKNYFFVFYTNLVNEEQESEPTAISKVAQNSFLWHAQTGWKLIYPRNNCWACINCRSCRVIMLRNLKLMTSIFPLLRDRFFFSLFADWLHSIQGTFYTILEKFCQQKKKLL